MKKTYKQPRFNKSVIKINNGVEGETIEQKINRILNSNEPIKDGAPLVYTERKDGVKPEYNIRTDRFEIALDAMDKYQKSITNQRLERLGNNELGSGDPSIQTTSNERN